MRLKRTITSSAQMDILSKMDALGISQQDLATMLGWSKSTLHRKLTGARGISIVEMLKLQNTLAKCWAEKELHNGTH